MIEIPRTQKASGRAAGKESAPRGCCCWRDTFDRVRSPVGAPSDDVAGRSVSWVAWDRRSRPRSRLRHSRCLAFYADRPSIFFVRSYRSFVARRISGLCLLSVVIILVREAFTRFSDVWSAAERCFPAAVRGRQSSAWPTHSRAFLFLLPRFSSGVRSSFSSCCWLPKWSLKKPNLANCRSCDRPPSRKEVLGLLSRAPRVDPAGDTLWPWSGKDRPVYINAVFWQWAKCGCDILTLAITQTATSSQVFNQQHLAFYTDGH